MIQLGRYIEYQSSYFGLKKGNGGNNIVARTCEASVEGRSKTESEMTYHLGASRLEMGNENCINRSPNNEASCS